MKLVHLLFISTFTVISGLPSLGAPPPDWRPTYRFCLNDTDGRCILPAKFRSIEYKGNGIFLTTSPDYSEKRIFNRDGKELAFALPESATLINIYFSKNNNFDDSIAPVELLDDAIIEFKSGSGTGLCDKDGRVILTPSNTKLVSVSEGLALVRYLARKPLQGKPKNTIYSIIDLETGHSLPVSKELSTVLTPFREGIAIARVTGRPQATAFLFKNGNVRVMNSIVSARPFSAGLSSILIRGSNSGNAIINTDLEIVSPKGMDVYSFHGDLAVAGPRDKQTNMLGLVDRSFKYRLEPRYQEIIPIFYNGTEVENLLQAKKPVFYFARENKRHYALSSEGVLLFEFPEGITRQPCIQGSMIRCYFISEDEKLRGTVYLDMTGKVLDKSDSVSNSCTAFELAPGRYLDRVRIHNGFLDGPNRLALFSEFLTRYDLIGMNQQDVVRLLVPHRKNNENFDSISIFLSNASGCGAGDSLGLKIFFRNEQVVQWCFTRGGKECAPYRDNVVFPSRLLNSFLAEPVMISKPRLLEN